NDEGRGSDERRCAALFRGSASTDERSSTRPYQRVYEGIEGERRRRAGIAGARQQPDLDHDIIEVGGVVEPGYPGGIRRACGGERVQQDGQRDGEEYGHATG